MQSIIIQEIWQKNHKEKELESKSSCTKNLNEAQAVSYILY